MDPSRRPAATMPEPAAIVPLLLLTVVWGWWGWKQGGYFGTVRLPGIILLSAGTFLMTRVAPLRATLAAAPAVQVAMFALLGLASWYLISILWTPAPDFAITDAQRVFAYAISFGFGICLCNLLAARMTLSVLPIAVAGGLVALATVLTILTGDDLKHYLEPDGTLQFPLGYRNANGAFFGIAFWALVGLTTASSLAWWSRPLAAAGATLCLSLVLLSQSRGSELAGAVSLVVFFWFMPHRARAVVWLGVAALPCVLVAPHLSELFNGAEVRPPVDAVQSAGAACLGAGAISLLAGAALALAAKARPVSSEAEARADHVAGRSLIALAVVVAVGLVVAVGNPVTWIGDKADQFGQGFGTGGEQSTRFGLNVGTVREPVWRVALDDGGRNPILGDGAGGFQYSYLEHRDDQFLTVRDGHSVELETLSELGIPGLAMLLTFLGGAGVAIHKSRRLGPSAALLGAIALTAGSYWLVHTSVDWFWEYPVVTAPVMALLGAACAPAARTPGLVRPGRGRLAVAVGAVVLAISAIPPFLSERYTNLAFKDFRTDFPQAMSDIDRAHSIFPLSIDPLMSKGAIAQEAGDRGLAIAAFTKAADQRPEEWAAHYYLSLLYVRSNPARARQELDAATAVNPLQPDLETLRKRLE
jgi:hypothetical protein